MKVKMFTSIGLIAAMSAAMVTGCGEKTSTEMGDTKVIKIGIFEPMTGEMGAVDFRKYWVCAMRTRCTRLSP